ncbi:MAG: tyrosine-protein phosphatase, partial [Oscillospiraceae bacterium]
ALILTTLGVPFETVIQDYMLTNKMREKSLEKMIEKFSPLLKNVEPNADVKAVFTQIAGVEEENLRVTFDEIYKKYKTFDEYLYSEFAIDDNARNILRRKYLQ